MKDNNDHYDGAILEDIQDQVRRLAETLAEVPSKVRAIDERLVDVEADVKVIKAAVTDQSQQLHNHEDRITHLEQAA